MKSPIGSPKTGDLLRFAKLTKIGCIVCRVHLNVYREPDMHHLLSGGRRIGHQATIPLCPWHHRAVSDLPEKEATKLMGPSLAKSPKKFRETFGNDAELIEATDYLLNSLGKSSGK